MRVSFARRAVRTGVGSVQLQVWTAEVAGDEVDEASRAGEVLARAEDDLAGACLALAVEVTLPLGELIVEAEQ